MAQKSDSCRCGAGSCGEGLQQEGFLTRPVRNSDGGAGRAQLFRNPVSIASEKRR